MPRRKLTSQRKLEHLQIVAHEPIESVSRFGDVELLHRALPEVNRREIRLETPFLGKTLRVPLMIVSMTGGHPATRRVNRRLGEAAEKVGMGIGVGSQRAALEDPHLVETYRVVREAAPTTFVYGNIGVPQLRKYGVEGVRRIVEMVEADALAIHLNFLQEAVQPEGDLDARGCLGMVRQVCRGLRVPVLVKETGAGISREVALQLRGAGVAALDVGGLGGTNFALVEALRAHRRRDRLQEHLGRVFADWGIPTPLSILECQGLGLPVVATGGIRSGLDVAKSIALGATAASAGLPFIKAAMTSTRMVEETAQTMVEELRTAMFLTGSRRPRDLRRAPLLLTGRTREMAEQRGLWDPRRARAPRGTR
ncbi:MAG: type 2 isopentenyl-diphosphate Delta-isomerase [Euryarchaeota archaeon]|nr:type 2 isopentenyl-diphosphate Delta-isomerase [Euryarchaeota archaeon]